MTKTNSPELRLPSADESDKLFIGKGDPTVEIHNKLLESYNT